MKIYLIRHAKGVKRSRWDGPDRLRLLTSEGRRQARGIVETLREEPVLGRILASPFLRCRQTLEPLAAARAQPLELDERLGEGRDPTKAVELIETLGEAPAVVCTHADLIVAVLSAFESQGMVIEHEIAFEKGSMWVLEGSGPLPERAGYRPPLHVEEPVRVPGSQPGPTIASSSANLTKHHIRLGVLDLGSTSFHLLVADAAADGTLRPVASERAMLRLGSILGAGRGVDEAACARVESTAAELRRAARKHGVEWLLPIATAAVRDAANGRKLAERIGKALDAPVRVLGGEQEARLMFGAFQRRGALGAGLSLGLDLGGGSLELAVGNTRELDYEATLPLGVARLHGEFVRGDPMRDKDRRRIRERVKQLLAPHEEALGRLAPRACVATGGTIRALARLVAAGRGIDPDGDVQDFRLGREELAELAKRLVASRHDQRLAMRGIRRRRADLLPVGAVILDCVAEELGLAEVAVCDWGLREGVLLEALGLAHADRLAA